jgi:hypothetical protein
MAFTPKKFHSFARAKENPAFKFVEPETRIK